MCVAYVAAFMTSCQSSPRNRSSWVLRDSCCLAGWRVRGCRQGDLPEERQEVKNPMVYKLCEKELTLLEQDLDRSGGQGHMTPEPQRRRPRHEVLGPREPLRV